MLLLSFVFLMLAALVRAKGKDAFSTLGVKRSAASDKAAYRQLSLKYHHPQNVHIITVATKGTTRLTRMEQQCREKGFVCHILGKNQKWGGWKWMISLVLHELDRVPKHDLVVVMDALDVLIQANASTVSTVYQDSVPRSKSKLAVALETSCPNHACPDVVDPNATSTGIPNLQHVNGGWMMGPPLVLQKALSFMGRGGDPQVNLGHYALQHPDAVHIDTEQRFCANIVTDQFDEWHTYYERVRSKGQNVIQNVRTGVTPHFIHFPGTQEVHRGNTKLAKRLVAWDDAIQWIKGRV